MVIQFASTIYLIKLVRAKRVLSNISRCSGIIDNNLVIVYDGIFETFGSKIRDEIPWIPEIIHRIISLPSALNKGNIKNIIFNLEG